MVDMAICLKSRMVFIELASGKLFGSLTLSSSRIPDGVSAIARKSISGLADGMVQSISAKYPLIHAISSDKNMLVKDVIDPNSPNHWSIIVNRNFQD